MVEVQKQPRENIGSMLRRFSERIKKSGILIEAKESQWRKKPKTRRARRLTAIARAKRQTENKVKMRQGVYQ